MWIDWCVAVCFLKFGFSNAEITQPWSLVLQEGKTARIECEQKYQHNVMFWYRQGADPGLQLLFHYYYSEQQPAGNVSDRFTADMPKEDRLILNISPAKLEDSAVYFCASSRARDSEAYFGKGTRLTVLGPDQKVRTPQVTVFAPSKQEVDEKEKATIVCLVTNFFPDHVALSWILNNKERTAGVKTEDPVYNTSTNHYSMTSRLRITREEWQNSDNKFVCRVSFHGIEGSTDHEDSINGADCGGGSKAARESYLTEANLGKLVYILLIFKSALYGAFVMGLKLRKKLAT